jgi:hypothetical protein
LPLIPLNRRFIEWRQTEKDELSDPDLLSRLGVRDGAKTWDDLLKRRRVVILAEAGSGKSEELKGQALRLAADGKVAFYVTVQDVGRLSLENAISAEDRPKLAVWRRSDQPAWFFIDSVDEAKLDGVRLERALRNIADAIHSIEGRAHIVLSSRHTDWEFRRDLARLQDILPLPPDQTAPTAPSADELLIRTLHNEQPPEPAAPETPVVVVLASLDAERVRIFAQAKGASNLDAMMAEIDASNLWRFARRPLDLDWLVQFWKSNQRLGPLAEMLATSLRERLRESDPVRARHDVIDIDRAGQALERIGAALVFGRLITLSIPDGEIVLTGPNPGFDLAHVLPDWSETDRARLLGRPVFDPATFGRVRLHNDNEGVVRAYLAARWLQRLRQANLSRTGLFNLLFADVYGVQLVKPSLQETAAWLAIWDPDVAREVIHREPYLLLTGGDPGSLPPEVRASALTRVIERMVANDEHLPLLDPDSVKRFARPDLAPVIRQLWPIHKHHEQARDLLLRLIWLGELHECANLAAEASADRSGSRHDQVVAGRAFMATADDAKKVGYAAQIVRECASRPPTVVWDTVETLFPSVLGIDDLLAILSRVDVTDRDGGVGFQWQSPELIGRVDDPADLERLLVGLLALIGPEPDDSRPNRDEREEAFLAAIGSAAHRLLLRTSPDTASAATIDAASRIGRHSRFGRGSLWDKVGDAGAELRKTSARRRLAFWRATERMRGHRYLQQQPVQHPWQMEILGWSPGLTPEDVDWLIADGPTREAEHQRKLAVNAALYIWVHAGRPDAVRERIQRAAAADPTMREAYEEWMRPRPPDPALEEDERRLREVQEENAIARAEGDQSWRDFVDRLRADPDQLRHLNQATAEGIDNRLYYLWRLLSSTVQGNSRYTIDSVVAVEPMLGRDLAAALRDGLIRHWRSWEPTRKSARAPQDRNSVRTLDVMGIAGVSLEAAGSPNWANQLDAHLAHRATVYATLEINGFPKWMTDVSVRWPSEVAAVLRGEVAGELDLPNARFAVLYDIGRSDDRTLAVMVPSLLDELERRPDLPAPVLSQVLDALERAPRAGDLAHLMAIAIPRFHSVTDIRITGLYLAAMFGVDPEAATDALMTKLDGLSVGDQTLLVQGALPSIFGDRWSRERRLPELSFHNLERLVRLAFEVIRVEEDNDRPSGEVYSPDARDNAESARSAAFKQLTEIPGRATFNALLRLAEVPGFPISPRRLRALTRERACADAEAAPWPPGEAWGFEDKCETLPQTPLDLQRLLLARLSDLQHSLLHDDFAQGSTLCGLAGERAVQNWMGDYLRRSQGRSYSIEREPHVVGEKEPDIRTRSANDASVSTEIKIAESWTLEELEAALVDQLCGRYLRARGGRHGVLLLVHQKARSRGWTNRKDGRRLDFAAVVEHLRLLAKSIAGADADSPQPEIAIIDVSSCAATKPPVRKASPAKARPRAVARSSTSRTRRKRRPSKKPRDKRA